MAGSGLTASDTPWARSTRRLLGVLLFLLSVLLVVAPLVFAVLEWEGSQRATFCEGALHLCGFVCHQRVEVPAALGATAIGLLVHTFVVRVLLVSRRRLVTQAEFDYGWTALLVMLACSAAALFSYGILVPDAPCPDLALPESCNPDYSPWFVLAGSALGLAAHPYLFRMLFIRIRGYVTKEEYAQLFGRLRLRRRST